MDDGRTGRLLREALGESPPPAPVEQMWSGVRGRLPAPRGRLLGLPAAVLTVAAAAALLLAAVLLLAPARHEEAPRLKLRIVDVERTGERELSREEAASIFGGAETPVLLGAGDVPDGGGG